MIVGNLSGNDVGNELIEVFDDFPGIFWFQTDDVICVLHFEGNDDGHIGGRAGTNRVVSISAEQ